LSAATTKRVSEEISHLVHEERLDISISGMIIFVISKTIVNICLLKLTDLFGAGDIWSENGISMFALTGYWIDPTWKFREVLLHCAPITTQAHTGAVIEKLTLDILVGL
jgi:hypothetical protein